MAPVYTSTNVNIGNAYAFSVRPPIETPEADVIATQQFMSGLIVSEQPEVARGVGQLFAEIITSASARAINSVSLYDFAACESVIGEEAWRCLSMVHKEALSGHSALEAASKVFMSVMLGDETSSHSKEFTSRVPSAFLTMLSGATGSAVNFNAFQKEHLLSLTREYLPREHHLSSRSRRVPDLSSLPVQPSFAERDKLIRPEDILTFYRQHPTSLPLSHLPESVATFLVEYALERGADKSVFFRTSVDRRAGIEYQSISKTAPETAMKILRYAGIRVIAIHDDVYLLQDRAGAVVAVQRDESMNSPVLFHSAESDHFFPKEKLCLTEKHGLLKLKEIKRRIDRVRDVTLYETDSEKSGARYYLVNHWKVSLEGYRSFEPGLPSHYFHEDGLLAVPAIGFYGKPVILNGAQTDLLHMKDGDVLIENDGTPAANRFFPHRFRSTDEYGRVSRLGARYIGDTKTAIVQRPAPKRTDDKPYDMSGDTRYLSAVEFEGLKPGARQLEVNEIRSLLGEMIPVVQEPSFGMELEFYTDGYGVFVHTMSSRHTKNKLVDVMEFFITVNGYLKRKIAVEVGVDSERVRERLMGVKTLLEKYPAEIWQNVSEVVFYHNAPDVYGEDCGGDYNTNTQGVRIFLSDFKRGMSDWDESILRHEFGHGVEQLARKTEPTFEEMMLLAIVEGGINAYDAMSSIDPQVSVNHARDTWGEYFAYGFSAYLKASKIYTRESPIISCLIEYALHLVRQAGSPA